MTKLTDWMARIVIFGAFAGFGYGCIHFHVVWLLTLVLGFLAGVALLGNSYASLRQEVEDIWKLYGKLRDDSIDVYLKFITCLGTLINAQELHPDIPKLTLEEAREVLSKHKSELEAPEQVAASSE